jgi:uncharacterized repeat protein (TIGR01451 family)
MKKKLIFLAFLAFFICFSCFAAGSYEGWLYNSRNFNFDGVLYKVLISSGGNTIIFSSDTTFSVNIGECYLKDYTKFCYNLSSYDRELEDFKAYVHIYNTLPNIEISRNANNNILEVGETATFTTILENIGDKEAEGIVFTDEFPLNAEITKVRNAEIKNNAIYWKGDLNPGETRTITYEIKSIGKIDQYTMAFITYFDGFEEKQVFSGQIRLYSTPVLEISLSTDKEGYQINEKIIFTLTLKNNGDRDIDIYDLNLIIPKNVEVAEKDYLFDLLDSNYFWKGKIEPGETMSFVFELRAKNKGISFIILNGNYDYKRTRNNIPNTQHGFFVDNEGIELTSSIASTEFLSSNELKRIYVKARNKNSFSNLNNLNLRITSELPGFENQTYRILWANSTIFLLDRVLRMPEIESEKVYRVRFNLSYDTNEGDTFSEILDRTIVLRPTKKITLEPVFSSYSIKEKEIIEISVKAKNPESKEISSVFVYAEIPGSFTIKGSSSGYFNLDANEEKEVLSFSINPGLVDEDEDRDIIFYAEYIDENKEYRVESIKKIKINRILPDISVEKKVPKPDMHEGEMFFISYTILNQDEYPIHELRLVFSKNQAFDSLNFFEFEKERLNPGESISFEEELRAKKQGTYTLGESILYYKDQHGRSFNKSSNSPNLNIKNNNINGPALFAEQSSLLEVNLEQPLLVKITLTNFGNEPVESMIGDNIETITDSFVYYEEIFFDHIGSFSIPQKQFDYKYLGNNMRAYSNELNVNVKDQETIMEIIEDQDPIINDDEEQLIVAEEKKSFFAGIYNWFKGLFSKKNS